MLRQVRTELMKNNLIEAVLGAIVLFVAGYFLVFAYTFGNHHGDKGYFVIAKFERIDGLVVGGDVKISGVKVGKVDRIEVDPLSYQAKVTVTVAQHIKVPDDSTAEIASESLLGGKYFAIVPGISETMIQPGGMIIKTNSSVSFEALINKFLFTKDEGGKKTEDKKAA